MVIERDVVLLRSALRRRHGEVEFRAVSWAVGTLAPGFAAAFVALDERAAEEGVERGQLTDQSRSTTPQRSVRLSLHSCRTSY